nr:BAHD acyltransferase [Echium plantagineum]
MALHIGVPELISKKFIRPSSSTPPHLNPYKLSIFDQLMISKYIPIAFLYPNNPQNQPTFSSSFLQSSLSKILASYYPLAGRLIENHSIDCNDEGATFIEARVSFPMSEMLQQPQRLHEVVFPEMLPWASVSQVREEDRSLIVVQLSHFECGSKAVSVCMSHKIGDANSLCNFLQDWAALNRGDTCSEPCPGFDAHSFFPPVEDLSMKLPSDSLLGATQGSVVTRKYTFRGSKIRELKSRAIAETGILDPTRVEVVTALLFSCAYKANAAVGKSCTSSIFVQANLRSLMNPPLSTNTFGNLVRLMNFDLSSKDEKEICFSRFVSELRRTKIQFQDKIEAISAEELHMEMVEKMSSAESNKEDNVIDSYACSSWCRFKFYDVDFGWGKPEVVSLAPGTRKNIIMLMDDKHGDGIEAMIFLSEQAMPLFQQDADLLDFASSS